MIDILKFKFNLIQLISIIKLGDGKSGNVYLFHNKIMNSNEYHKDR